MSRMNICHVFNKKLISEINNSHKLIRNKIGNPPEKKWAKNLARHFTERRLNGQQVYDKVHSIVTHQENAN